MYTQLYKIIFCFAIFGMIACNSDEDKNQPVVDAIYITHGIYGEAIYGVVPSPIVSSGNIDSQGPYDTDDLGMGFEGQDTWTPLAGMAGTADINFETCSSTNLVLTLVGKVVGKNLDKTHLYLAEGTSNTRTEFYPHQPGDELDDGAYGQFINSDGEYIFYVNLDEHATIMGQNGFDIMVYANDIQDTDALFDYGTHLFSTTARTNHQVICN